MQQRDDIIIRVAREEDAPALLAIYAPYVEQTAITFAYQAPSLAEFTATLRQVQQKYPYLVAEQQGELLGYVYANTFHEREAYDWAVETSIYIRSDCRRTGLGRILYEALEAVLTEQHIINLNADIAFIRTPDEHLTLDSVKFHTRMGYHMAGHFRQCGYKFSRWYDIVWMEKHLGEHPDHPAAVRWFPQVRTLIFEKYGIR